MSRLSRPWLACAAAAATAALPPVLAEAVKSSLVEADGGGGAGGAFPNRIGLVFGVSSSAGRLVSARLIVEAAAAAVGPTGLNTAASDGSLTSSFMSELLSALFTKVCKILTT